MTMNKQDFARLVWKMRKAQKDYYASSHEGASRIGKARLLNEALKLEKQVDQELERMIQEAVQLKVWK